MSGESLPRSHLSCPHLFGIGTRRSHVPATLCMEQVGHSQPADTRAVNVATGEVYAERNSPRSVETARDIRSQPGVGSGRTLAIAEQSREGSLPQYYCVTPRPIVQNHGKRHGRGGTGKPQVTTGYAHKADRRRRYPSSYPVRVASCSTSASSCLRCALLAVLVAAIARIAWS